MAATPTLNKSHLHQRSLCGENVDKGERLLCTHRATHAYIPIFFCLWSYIIFSTMERVSPSRSESCEFSGATFCVSISGSPLSTQLHHSVPDSCRCRGARQRSSERL